MMEGHVQATYRSYWIAWAVLLAITLLMVLTGRPAVLLAGIAVKAAIIALWFMHLKWERRDFTVTIITVTLMTGLVLFALIAPDGSAM